VAVIGRSDGVVGAAEDLLVIDARPLVARIFGSIRVQRVLGVGDDPHLYAVRRAVDQLVDDVRQLQLVRG
jgi:hypothetical protein